MNARLSRQQNHNDSSTGAPRRARALLVAALVAAGLITGATPAEAAVTGYMTSAGCGWHLVAGPADPYKITTGTFPRVTGVYSSNQLVRMLIVFRHPVNGAWQIYRSGWFYTFAHYGAWTSGWWRAYSDGRAYTRADDAPGESGYATGDAGTDFTSVSLVVQWFYGSTLVGQAVQHEKNANYDPQWGPYICNAGSNYA